jgi:phosphotriesterase-related protein
MDAAMSVVRTIRGDVPAADPGRVDAHEHVFLRSPELPGSDFLDPVKMQEELTDVRAHSIDTIVDLTTVGLGRQPRELATVSAASGVNVVAATGFHRDAHYRADHWIYRASTAALLDVIMADLTTGIDAADWGGPFQDPTDHEVRDRGEENGQRDRRLRMSEGRSPVLDRTFHVIDRVDDRDGTQIRKQRTT